MEHSTLMRAFRQVDNYFVNLPGLKGFFEATGYPLLATNWPTILFWTLFFHFVSNSSLILLAIIKRQKIEKIDKKLQMSWRSHVTSQVHALVAVAFSLTALYQNNLADDRVHGFDKLILSATNFSLGYFLWDLHLCIIDFSGQGPQFLAHAVLGALNLVPPYVPNVMYYVPVFLFFEASTIFLNMVWFCDKVGLSGSTFQLVNGVLLAIVFFFVRLVFGTLKMIQFYKDVAIDAENVGIMLYILAHLSITVFWSLNVFWFYKIVQSIIKKCKASVATKDDLKKE
ncbi:putative TLC domain-containing protein [Zancudomyces culisetae]|uniref:Putative TLC domain-containing protein n=1 Tax=Zancudomyces culisetae TaxID=1213189 RepID=A0A1R1PXH1_ZANCU|nr:putative TLC domain-containing protein [Zancudomyces culisetae]|eukprot:OMH85623.1 putative TLC domain-containing protein [Zancudomyces culisetae]